MDSIFRKLGWSAGSRRQQGESLSHRRRNNMDMASPRPLTYHLLEEITNGFSEQRKLGTGAYGSVYMGEYKDGEKIAVKMLHDVLALDNEQFEKEYFNLANLQHKNIVRLVGYCHETRRECVPYEGKFVFADMTKRALCFEYMHNGGLDKCLSDETSGHDWCTRYSIIKGICEGLKYLHEELESPMYHLDLKPANVLLDEKMMPKIADFGLSRFFTGDLTKITKSAIGTHGYVPPEYIDASVISIKFDIFSLGVVIIKIMTGPTGYFRSEEISAKQFIELVLANWKKRLDATSVYPLELYSEQVKRCTEIALSCVEADRSKRPSIGEIVNKLNETETMIQNMLRTDIGSSVDQSASLPGISDLCMTVKSASSTGKGRSKLSSTKVIHGFHLVEGESQEHEMEDYHVAKFKYENNHELGLFAIFDGHWGDWVPRYLKANLFCNILKEPLFWTDPQEAIKNAYGSTNKHILENVQQLVPGGSTAVTAIVYDGKDMWIANVGDSRAVLCERGAANQVTVDHEPHATKERQRIEQHGGSVTTIPGDVPRVNGQLAVARAFGHYSLKTHLSSEPDVRHVPINSTIEFVILASDGLWKVMRNQEAVDLVRSMKDPQAAADERSSSEEEQGRHLLHRHPFPFSVHPRCDIQQQSICDLILRNEQAD